MRGEKQRYRKPSVRQVIVILWSGAQSDQRLISPSCLILLKVSISGVKLKYLSCSVSLCSVAWDDLILLRVERSQCGYFIQSQLVPAPHCHRVLSTGQAGREGETAESLLGAAGGTGVPGLADHFILINQLQLTELGVVCAEMHPSYPALGLRGDTDRGDDGH